MTLITHVIMQSKSKVGTRNVRVKIERQVGVVLTVEFNGTPLIDAEKGVFENAEN